MSSLNIRQENIKEKSPIVVARGNLVSGTWNKNSPIEEAPLECKKMQIKSKLKTKALLLEHSAYKYLQDSEFSIGSDIAIDQHCWNWIALTG